MMIVKVKFYKDHLGGYGGMEYTYRTDLPVREYVKVLAPVGTEPEPKRAIVTQVNLPEETIQPEWEDKVKWITQYDTEEEM